MRLTTATARISILGAVMTMLLAAAPLRAQNSVLGDWKNPTGSVIHIGKCGGDLCLTLLAISPQSPTHFDDHNPDASMRSRSICGLRIGSGFHESGAGHADGGSLYDPKTGKTYHGEMTADGDKLDLRGYVGIKMFGRSETWTRTGSVPVCTA
jgi:uncharacterized protein (DUF2147 family)